MTTRNRELASIIDDSGNITAGGNLTVSGTTLTSSSTVETHADPLIELNTGAGSNSNDLGFVFERGSTGDNACIIWDESNDGFAVGTTTATGTSTGNMTFTAADFAAGKVTVDNVLINGTTIGHTSDTDLLTLADGVLTVAGEVSMTTLDIGGTNVTSTAAELNILDGVTSTAAELNILDGVTATAAEINFLDGDTSATGTTLASADRVIVNDGGTMKQVALSDFETFFESEIDTFSTIDINGGTIDGATVGANSASSGAFTTLSASGALTGTLGTAAQTNITSLGTLTALTVDNLGINGNTITANSGALNLTPASGSAIVLDGTISVDAGVVTGATSITSTAFVGNITGNVTGNTSGTAATVTTAAQTNITSLGTLTTLTVDNVIVNGTTIGHTSDTDLLTLASGGLTVAGTLGVTGVISPTTHIDMPDSAAIKLGTGDDLTIQHDGSDSTIIDSGTGNFLIGSDSFYLRNAANDETMLRADENSYVKLYYDNAEKLATVTGGINITGDTDTDTLTVSGTTTIANTSAANVNNESHVLIRNLANGNIVTDQLTFNCAEDKLGVGTNMFISGGYIRSGAANLGFGTASIGQIVTLENSSGHVGINDQDPSYTLDVDGDINFTGTLREDGTEFSGGIGIGKAIVMAIVFG
jgi:hypothetical protein